MATSTQQTKIETGMYKFQGDTLTMIVHGVEDGIVEYEWFGVYAADAQLSKKPEAEFREMIDGGWEKVRLFGQ